MFFSSMKLLAQQSTEGDKTVLPPLPFREISGIVKDEKGDGLAGATVLLKSDADTLTTITNSGGVFVFNKVKRATFFITVSGIGIKQTTKKYLNNDLLKQIVLDPFELSQQAIVLNEVNINGAPTITYKVDTVEYRATDYTVRKDATVDELLKKMEGMEVGNDGSLLYMGQQVTKAKLNGKAFAGGGVAQTIQNLPADIVEKVQIVDDYGDQAARTGVKGGAPQKTLNLTTKDDKSIGTYSNTAVQAGNNSRFNVNAIVTHIDANEQLAFLGNVNNTVSGISSGITGGGGAGTSKSTNPAISYSDQWSKKMNVTASYNYNLNETSLLNKSFGEIYSFGQNSIVRNTSSFNRESMAESHHTSQKMAAEIEYNFDKWNYLKISPTFDYTATSSSSNTLTDNLNNFVTGFEHPVVKDISSSVNTSTVYAVTTLYQHFFKNQTRNISVQIGITGSNTRANGEKNTDYRFFVDSTQNTLLKDSLSHLLINRSSRNRDFNTTIIYVEPVNRYGRLEFTGKFNRSSYDNVTTADTVLADGRQVELSRLSNIFDYTFSETRLTANYNYSHGKINFSAGASAIPTVLSGTRVNNNNNQEVSSSLANFRVIPVLQVAYSLSATHKISINYIGNNSIPDFQQIQPFTDRSDPNNIITGNPNLRPTFTNILTISYNNYLGNSKVNIGINITATDYKDRIANNIIQHPELISGSVNRFTTIYETTFVNLNGSHAMGTNYSLSKQLQDNKFIFSINGLADYKYDNAMSNDVLYHSVTWRINERFGPRFSSSNSNIAINPYVAYDITKTFTSLPGVAGTAVRIATLAVDGKVYFSGTWNINYSVSKNYVQGLGSLNTNPFIINAGFQKQLFKKNNLMFTFNAYDLLHQNNFIRQSITPQGVTNTLSNSLSRYFLIGLRGTFQKWGGKPTRGGQKLKRKGDGSFIY